MQVQTHQFTYTVYPSAMQLQAADAALLQQALAISKTAYAPYSKFYVGAAALLSNGAIVTGTNQENGSFPAGLCAERVLLSAVTSLHPNTAINTIAISYSSNLLQSNHPLSPCGVCRQSLAEYEERLQQPIRILLAGASGEVWEIAAATLLLPFAFNGGFLKKQ
ncbi:MAG: hypothetical protein RLZZ316_535 [Bacteroidota bacterium]